MDILIILFVVGLAASFFCFQALYWAEEKKSLVWKRIAIFSLGIDVITLIFMIACI